jgi:polar amino acid transport system substrate-binding protein
MLRCATWVVVLALAAGSAAARDLAEIKARGTLRVIAQRDEAPEMFRFAGGGEPGFEREMIEGFARVHGLTVEPVQVATSGARIPALRRGDGDVITGIVDTEERRRLVAFTGEVLPARHVVVTWAPHAVVRTLEEFRAEKVGVVSNTSWAQAALDAGVPEDATGQFPDRDDVFAALADGRITATVMTTTDFLLATRLHPELQGGLALGGRGSAAWAVRSDDADLLAALDEYLSNYRAGSSWSRLVVKYFGDKALAALGRE